MLCNRTRRSILALALAFALPLAHAQSVGSAFTYQGELRASGTAATAAFDFQFRLYNSAGGSTQLGAQVTANAVAVTNGLFSVPLDFGPAQFAGDAQWLEISVRPAGSGTFETLSPRTAVTATPYALGAVAALANSVTTTSIVDGSVQFSDVSAAQFQARVTGTCAGSQGIQSIGANGTVVCGTFGGGGGTITGVTAGTGLAGGGTSGTVTVSIANSGVGTAQINPDQVQRRVTGNCPSGQYVRSVNQDGTVVCGTDAGGAAGWGLTGNTGTNPATQFIGTTDAQPLVLRSNNSQTARFGERTIGLFGLPIADTELTVRSNDLGGSQFSNVFLEPNSFGAEREGILISVGGGTAGSNNRSLFLDQYNALNQEQKRRLVIDDNGLMTLPGPGLSFGSQTRQMLNLWGPSIYGIGVQSSTHYFRTAAGGQFAWFAGGEHNDATLDPGAGGTRAMSLNSAGQLELTNAAGANPTSPRLRLSFGATGTLSNRFWDITATRNQINPGGVAIPAGSLIFSDDVGLKAAFDINGLARNASGTWTSWSDARLKTNVQDIATPLDTLLAMRGHWFEYKDPKAVMAQPGPRMGLIAQEVREAVPQWVSEGPDGMLSVTPTGFEALAIEAMRELRDEGTAIDAVQADEIEALRAENAQLRARLARIEARLARQ